MLSWELTV